jgi:hypothetical protein|tara:strand:+ start:360 stop:1541 length:1182 start_codon:yes stop_codon:yes gene_type:complete
MAAATIDNYLAVESGRLTYDIYQRTLYSSPWLSLPKKVAWPQEMGETISNVMFERPYVATETAWTAVSFNDASGNSCIPPSDTVSFHQTLREMQLFHKSVYSPRFCVNDLLFTGARQKQMESVIRALNEQVRYYWIKWNRDNWTEWSNKVIAEPGLDTTEEGSATFGTTEATSQLTNGLLDHFYETLILEQGSMHSLSTQNGRPIFGLITDQVSSRRLTRDDDAIREDFRKSSRRDELLGPLGVSHTYNGFIHMIDDMPPRYTFAGGVYTLVEPYILDSSDATNPKLAVNPAWRSAGFQDSYIYLRNAIQFRVPASVTGVSKAKFNPQNYMGDFRWLNIQNDDDTSTAYNPDKTIGRFRGVMMSASEGINPHLMFTIRHKVCTSDLGLTDCPA